MPMPKKNKKKTQEGEREGKKKRKRRKQKKGKGWGERKKLHVHFRYVVVRHIFTMKNRPLLRGYYAVSHRITTTYETKTSSTELSRSSRIDYIEIATYDKERERERVGRQIIFD